MHVFENGSTYAREILETVPLPLLAMGADLRVAYANSAYLSHFGVSWDETAGQPLWTLGNGQWSLPDLRRHIHEILGDNRAFAGYRLEHEFERLGPRVMRLDGRRIHSPGGEDTILLTITDITEPERLRRELEGRIEFSEKLIDSVREALLILHRDLRVHSANEPFYSLFEVNREETEERLVYELGNGQWDIPELRRLLENILPRESSFDDYEVDHTFRTLGRRVMLLNGRRLDHLNMIVLAIRDITELKGREERRRRRAAQQSLLVELSDRVRALAEPEGVLAAASELVGRYVGAAAVGFARLDRAARSIVLEGAWSRVGAASPDVTDVLRDHAGRLAGALDAGETLVVDGGGDPGAASAGGVNSSELGLLPALLLVPLAGNGHPTALLVVRDPPLQPWRAQEVSLVQDVGERVRVTVERARAQAALRESEQRLARELADVSLLQRLSAELVSDKPPRELYERIVAAARELMRSDAASVQGFDAEHGRLQLLAHSGFHPDSARHWQWVDAHFGSTCGRAIASGRRCVVADIGAFEASEGDLDAYRRSGIRAVQSTPLVSSNQRLVGMISTHWYRVHAPTDRELGHFDVLARLVADLLERQRSAAALRESEGRYRLLFESIDEGFAVVEPVADARSVVVDYRYVDVNPAFEAITGLSGVVGNTAIGLMPGLEPAWIETIAAVAADGEPQRFTRDVGVLGKTFDTFVFRIAGPDGWRVAILSRDVTERRLAEEQRSLLMREVNHRAKNILSIVQAIARVTAGSEGREFAEKFHQRIRALSTSQSLLVSREWRGVDMNALTRAQLAHLADLIDDRITLEGPSIVVSAGASQTLGMALHELATNAAKYGALSGAQGRVTVCWGLHRDDSGRERFRVSWDESGGPEVVAPQRSGFGSTVLSVMARMNLQAEIELDYAPIGLHWALECPAERCIEDGRAAPVEAPASGEGARPRSRPPGVSGRILVVEDEALMALEIAETLERSGFQVAGCASSLAQAMQMMEETPCDAAILDVNLGDDSAEPIARRLTDERVPFLVVSGYDRSQLPAAFRHARLLSKPVSLDRLVTELGHCLAGSEADGH